MFKNKKGIAQAVSWVLLIGFSVAIATFVGFWLRQTAEKSAEGLQDEITKKSRCADTSISATLIEGQCDNNKLKITNRGLFKVIKVRCRDSAVFDDVNLNPGDTTTVPLSSCKGNNNKIRISPFIKVEDLDVICADKTIQVDC